MSSPHQTTTMLSSFLLKHSIAYARILIGHTWVSDLASDWKKAQPFHRYTHKIFWSNNRTAFAQCVLAATMKYVRIGTFVVCGVSSRVLAQPWWWRHDSGGCCAWIVIVPVACQGMHVKLRQRAFHRCIWGKIGRSYEGLYLPGIRISMYVVTVTQKLLGHISYILLGHISYILITYEFVLCTLMKK